MSNIPVLELKNASKRYHHELILKNISLKLHQGEITALMGDNGAGKSTLIKMITGTHKMDGGEMYWMGQAVHYPAFNTPHYARSLGIQTVYQDLGLIDQLSLTQNFFLANEISKGFYPFQFLNKKLMNSIVLAELSRFGITKHQNPDVPIAALSGGERQTFTICRAMYFKSKLLILDEPTSALSSQQTEVINGHIRRAALHPMAVLLISHHKDQVKKLADRVIVLDHGSIIADVKKNESNFENVIMNSR